jgi:hypothetical protein
MLVDRYPFQTNDPTLTKMLEARLINAQQIIKHYEQCQAIWVWLPNDQVKIPSSQDSNTTHYTVSLFNGCNCPDASIGIASKYLYGWCKHMIALWLFTREEEEQDRVYWRF